MEEEALEIGGNQVEKRKGRSGQREQHEQRPDKNTQACSFTFSQ